MAYNKFQDILIKNVKEELILNFEMEFVLVVFEELLTNMLTERDHENEVMVKKVLENLE